MIDRKCKVTLGGLPQKIHVKGDETKPVLLFLHGGPGVCNRHTVMTVHADLQKEFLVGPSGAAAVLIAGRPWRR